MESAENTQTHRGTDRHKKKLHLKLDKIKKKNKTREQKKNVEQEERRTGGLWLNTYNVELVDFHVHLIYSRSCAEIKCKLWDKNEVQKEKTNADTGAKNNK